MRIKRKAIVSALLALAFLVVSAESCTSSSQVAVGGAEQVDTLGFEIPKNAQGHTSEQQNVIDRLKVTTDPTKVMWIHLLGLDGTIIRRMAVAHKVTSSGKRLQPLTASESSVYLPQVPFKKKDGTEGFFYTTEMIEADGTFGSSDAYIFWFDPQHRYHQWGTAGGLGYLLTDYPIDLSNPQDLVTGMYNTDVAAYQWQQVQEAQMDKEINDLCIAQGKSGYSHEAGGCQ